MKLTSYGAAGEVTGSCHLLEVGGARILLDCGLIQGRRKDELRNHDPFPFAPAMLDAVVLSHAHIDHSGRLPVLIRQGFEGSIHTHEASADLARILLKDSAYLNQKDVEYRNKRRARKGKAPLSPLYEQSDVDKTLTRFAPHRFGEPTEIAPGVTMTLHDAGHILGSAMVELELKESEESRTLVFSGDLGHRGAPILKDFTRLKKADLVLMESTYGNRLHRSWEQTFEEVSAIAESLKNTTGNVLIPAFSVGRSQMILYMFSRYFDAWDLGRWKIFLDSPMAIEATDLYLRYTRLYDETAAAYYEERGALLDMPNLVFSRSADESRAINTMESGAMVIAGSGMCTGGRIMHHLKHNLWRKDSHVIISGYQAHGSLGRQLVEGASSVKIWGEKIKVAATIHTVGGLSAHADQAGMLDWYSHFDRTPPVLLVHGEQKAGEVLAKKLHAEFGARAHVAVPGKTTDLLNPFR